MLAIGTGLRSHCNVNLCLISGSLTGARDGEGGDRPDEAHDRRVLRGGGRGLSRRGLADRDLAGGAVPGPEAPRRAHQHLQQLQVSPPRKSRVILS